ncbi:MAG: dockerin type I repeat-containing protein [Desulfococcaceae bacterium]|nr:dockerin type I repeat-containing protein [Desulfococcaceae bacterium]
MKNEIGQWGIPHKHLIMITGSRTITHAEYFFDNDPGNGNGIPIAQSNGEINTDIDTSGLTSGIHKLFVRMKDSENNWGQARQYAFEVFDASGQGLIADAECYTDTDPGIGEGRTLSPSDGNFDETEEDLEGEINTDELSLGSHTVYIRAQKSDGSWTRPPQSVTIEVLDPLASPNPESPDNNGSISESNAVFSWSSLQNAVSYEFFLDNNADFGSPEISETGLLSPSYTLSMQPENGVYYWKVRAKISDSIYTQWSVPRTVNLDIPDIEPGDVNGDGTVDLKDAIISLQIVAGMSPDNVKLAADINNDKKIGVEEAICILRKIGIYDFYLKLAQHYSPIIYQHVDTYGEHSLGGISDIILNFDFDSTWSGDVKWENLADYSKQIQAKATVYYAVVESEHYWFIYYAVYHPRDWSNLSEWYTMHENDMEAVSFMILKGNDNIGKPVAALSMSHNVWLEYPVEAYLTPINLDGRKDAGVTFIKNKSAVNFVNNGYYPRIFIQSRGHGIFMDENSNPCLNAGNAMGINRWDETGFPSALGFYYGTGLVYYADRNNEGYSFSNIWDKLIDSGGEQSGPADNYPLRWVNYQLTSIDQLWEKRTWITENKIGKEWMYTDDKNGFDAFYGPSPGDNEAHPPWSMPSKRVGIDVVGFCPPDGTVSLPGEIFYDPLSAYPKHFEGLVIPINEDYLYNPYD